MTETVKSDTRTRLLRAAADLVAASPGEDVPLRAICDAAGVRLPTLYHFFGSKDGLLDAVVAYGFDRYVEMKQQDESTGDPVRDLAQGWDVHVRFGLENPGFYALMYGQVTPGRRPPAQDGPYLLLLDLVRTIAEQGRLVVPPEQAAAHVLASNIGVTLRQIVLGEPDPELSDAVRDATIAAITGTGRREVDTAATLAKDLLAALPSSPAGLGTEETALLRAWLVRIGRGDDAPTPSGRQP